MRLGRGETSFDGPVYVACEGEADQYFLCRLLEHRRINGVDVAVVGGNDNKFTTHLKGLRVSNAFAKLRLIVIMTDNDTNPAASFASAQRCFRDAGFVVPDASWTKKEGEDVSTAILMLPSHSRPGALETLLVEAILDVRPQFARCLDDLKTCAEKPTTWDEVKLAKMRFHAAVAALCEDGPGTAASRIWSAKHNPVPITSDRFLPLVDFFQQTHPAP